MWLVLGLGNPGARYAGTRHNAGFLVLRELGRRWNLPVDRKQLGALTARGQLAGEPVLMAMPQGYMNRSGAPAGALQRFYKLPVERVLVVHDELDLPLGTVRIKQGGGHGGHNGLRDLHDHLGADFARIRVGISRPPPEWDSADYVLGRWSDQQRELVPRAVDQAADAVEGVLSEGLIAAMNSFNVRPRRPKARGNKNEPDTAAVEASGDATSAVAGVKSRTTPSGERS